VLRFAYSTINWGDTGDLESAFAEIRESGWNAVELFVHSLDWLGTQENLKTKLGGLRVATSFGAINLPTDKVQLGKLKNQIRYAGEAGATAFGLVGGGRLRWRSPSEDEYKELADFCEELAVHGQEHGVTVSYHPHTACTIETEEEIDKLVSLTSALQLCLDVSHIAVVDEDPVAHLKKYRDRIGYVHLKDWARGKFVEIGEGTLGIDFAAALKELEAQQFDGWVVVEQSRSDISPLVSAKKNAAYLGSLGYSPGTI
jgi:inosose dehydratase